jgi:hypothetical protein
MTNKNLLARPTQYLNMTTKEYPGAWKSLQEMRNDKGEGLPSWPDWCFTPMAAHSAIALSGKAHPSLTSLRDISILAALDAWRYTQGIYKFTKELDESISKTKINKNIPVDVLFRLPQWCVYVETPSIEGQFGFFAHLEHDIKTGRAELRLLLDQEDDLCPLILHLGDWSVEESIDRMISESNKQTEFLNECLSDQGEHVSPEMISAFKAVNDSKLVKSSMYDKAHGCISLLLYLCSDEPDIERIENSLPHIPSPKKTKKGFRFFPPKKPKVWNIGKELTKQLNVRSECKNGTHKRPIPHIRKAHWHGFWSGEKGSNLRKFNYKWLPPLLINANSLSSEYEMKNAA